LLRRKLDEANYIRYQGILGHYHVQLNKTDPGPAFDWDYVIQSARRELKVK
jgi:N-acetyl-anhydromuramyl-L-alanine amidase AmpD